MPVPAWFTEVLQHELRPWLDLSVNQVAKLYTHYEFLERWNRKMSLTSLEPGAELLVRHYCESLFLGAQLQGQDAARIVDVGSGAGFPGVPIAVLHSEWAVTLVESVQRKSVFLRESTRHLKNVTVLARRAEEIEGGFDWVVSRAVDPQEVLQSVPRLAPRIGLLIGDQSFPDLKSVPGIAWQEPIRLPWGDRRLCVLGTFHVEH